MKICYCFQYQILLGKYIIFYSKENSFLLSQLYDVDTYLLIGLTDRMYDGKYLWTDQSSVDYTNWYRNYYYYTSTDCVHFNIFNDKWVNRDCNIKAGFICQRRKYHNAIHKFGFPFLLLSFYYYFRIISFKKKIS